ncbi:MAG: hypothetical protein LBP90_04570, partial [Burkholderiales bacterium]|nr:hypothetical protein [Burkholderiales bacterium]
HEVIVWTFPHFEYAQEGQQRAVLLQKQYGEDQQGIQPEISRHSRKKDDGICSLWRCCTKVGLVDLKYGTVYVGKSL